MANPNYFEQLPNIMYGQTINRAGIVNYVKMKDFFRLMRVRDDIFAEDTLYREYVVQNGLRPERVAFELYGDERFYWVILQVNDIDDFWNQWPLNQVELETFITERYGSAADEVCHYETQEVKNDDGDVLLEGGFIVPQNFKFLYYPNPDSNDISLTSFPVAVTNRQKEFAANDEKASINIIDPKYIFDFEREYYNYARNLSDSISESYIQ